jgi:hypothetical protein
MKLTCAILKVKPCPRNDYHIVATFACADGEDTQMVNFVAEIDTCQASFLVNDVFQIDNNNAYEQMVRAIAEADIDTARAGELVGKTFTSED